MKKVLAPSMLAADFSKLGEQLIEIEQAGVKVLHVDVMDGLFVPSISFGMPVIASIRKSTQMLFDVHMMVMDPERYIEELAHCGADCISIHVEACKDVAACLGKIRELKVAPALAMNPETPIAKIEEFLPLCEEVVVMSVHPGFGGQKYIEETDEKVKELATLRKKLGLSFFIEVDGGIHMENAKRVLDCGADILVAGSAIFKNSLTENVIGFHQIMDAYED